MYVCFNILFSNSSGISRSIILLFGICPACNHKADEMATGFEREFVKREIGQQRVQILILRLSLWNACNRNAHNYKINMNSSCEMLI